MISEDIWLMSAYYSMSLNSGNHIVFDDVRFDNEANFIRSHGGLIIHIDRQVSNMNLDPHISENGIIFEAW